MITFGSEALFDVIEEVEPLLKDHYLALARNQDRVALKPDWDRYVDLQNAGAFFIHTARDDGDLVGYSAFFASRHPHYMDLMLVSNDVLWVAPEHRTGRTGVRFIRFCEDQIQQRYGKNIALTWHAKAGTTLEAMLPRMGYGLQDIVYSKLF